MKNQNPLNESSLGAQIMMATELGSTIVALTVAGYFAGNWADGALHSSPYGIVVGIMVGFALAMAIVIKRSNDMEARSRGKSPSQQVDEGTDGD